MIVQDIVNAVSIDTRQSLAPSGNDANVIMSWVDRVHKDVLHSSLYVNQNLATTSVTTAVATNSYTLSPATTIRRIVGIYDTTFNLSLTPSDADLDQPSPTQARVNEEQGRSMSTQSFPSPYQAYKFGGTPEYFRFIAPNTLVIRPAPPDFPWLSTLSVTYEQLVSTLASLTAPLIIPDDGKDVVVAGVNWMAMAYIGRQSEAMSWFQLYQQLKAGNRTGVIR
jgi:hypothetical protein